jgi:aconitate hydratase
MARPDPFSAKSVLETKHGTYTYYSLDALRRANIGHVEKLPYSIKVLLESMLRNLDGFIVTADDVAGLANWNAKAPVKEEIPFMPGRVVLQDFTGVPCVVDLAAMRDAMRCGPWAATRRRSTRWCRATSSSTIPCRWTRSRRRRR